MSSPLQLTPKQLRMAICLALAAITFALYWPLTHYDYINVDDPRFVFQNPHVQSGLTWTGIVWAFKSIYVETWQPITWLTHMLDCQLYGLNPGGHHFTSLLFHVANTLLLFLWLENLTKAPWRSACVAALFAWHPLHVESVAWICERKDVVSAFFWMLALIAYTRYVRKPAVGAYLIVLALYALALMSKPMAVTLPCVLFLLDFWPLNRFTQKPPSGVEAAVRQPWRSLADGIVRSCRVPGDAARQLPALLQKTAFLVGEKIPFFIVGLGMTAMTIYAEKSIVSGLGGLPLHLRVDNSLVSYMNYLGATLWPARLSYFYPYNFNLPLASVLGATVLLAVWTICFVMRMRQQPSLIVGWLWFLGTLAPTIGIIQYGAQARADRYMYLPGIGLFIVLVWGLNALLESRAAWQKLLPAIGCLALAGCLAASSVQLRYWQNSITLARHSIEITDHDYVAYESLGRALYQRGLKKEAIGCYREAVRIFPDFPQSQYNLGVALMDAGISDEAAEHFAAVVKIMPDDYDARIQLGTALLASTNNRLDEAASQLAEATRLNPDSADAHVELAVTLARQGETAKALPHFATAVQLAPANAEYRFDYGLALLNSHQPAGAASQFAEEVKLAPGETKAHYRLAQALEQQGKFAAAAQEYREALRLTPDFPEAKTALNQILSAHPDLTTNLSGTSTGQ